MLSFSTAKKIFVVAFTADIISGIMLGESIFNERIADAILGEWKVVIIPKNY